MYTARALAGTSRVPSTCPEVSEMPYAHCNVRCSPVHLEIVTHEIVKSSGRAAAEQVIDCCFRRRCSLLVFAPTLYGGCYICEQR